MKHDHSQLNTATARSLRGAYGNQRQIEDRVRRFLPLVHKAAWHIFGSGRDGLEVEDLVQVGLMALTDCARRHDGPTEDGFAAYAKMRVRGAMFDTLRKMAPVSRGAIKRLAQCEHWRTTFQTTHGRAPTTGELAELMDITPEAMAALEAEHIRIGPMDDEYDDHSTVFASDEPDAFAQICAMQDGERLATAIATLPERLQQVLQLYFVEELNLAEIAETLAVSVPRIHQLKASALDKLRAQLT